MTEQLGGGPVLNLGCGPTTSPLCVNIDWSMYLRLKRNPAMRLAAMHFLSRERRESLHELDANIMVQNLQDGIPFPDNSVGAVYHSHMLEHLDREAVPVFLREVMRILRSGGYIESACLTWNTSSNNISKT